MVWEPTVPRFQKCLELLEVITQRLGDVVLSSQQTAKSRLGTFASEDDKIERRRENMEKLNDFTTAFTTALRDLEFEENEEPIKEERIARTFLECCQKFDRFIETFLFNLIWSFIALLQQECRVVAGN
jgi:hypothetical protein